jgi:hypothetical protein
VLAWTSDARNRWAARWLDGWPEFSRFWSQVVRRASRPPDDPNRSLSVAIKGSEGSVRLEAQDDERRFLNFLPTQAQIVGPNGQALELPLQQVAPGTYEGRFGLSGDGVYLVQASQEVPNSDPVTQSGGAVAPYSQEFRSLGVNQTLLEEIARRTGGNVLREPTAAFARGSSETAVRQGRDLWPWLLALGGLLFLADIAVRRLRIEQIVHTRLWRRAAAFVSSAGQVRMPGPLHAQRAPVVAAAPSMLGTAPSSTSSAAAAAPEAAVGSASRLLAAKQRARAARTRPDSPRD